MLFKDGEVSRSLEVSENWLLRAGLAMLSLCLITVFSAAFALRVYWKNRPFTPATPSLEAVQPTVAAKEVAVVPTPSPTATPSTTKMSETETLAGVVAKLPTSSQAIEPNRLDVTELVASWSGRTIRVQFNIQTLTAESPGARQGRFIVLAYAKSGVSAYPPETLEKTQLNLRRGETYSVARFRPVSATIEVRRDIKDLSEVRVEALLLDGDLNLIVKKIVEVTGSPTTNPPVAKPKPPEPKPELITEQPTEE